MFQPDTIWGWGAWLLGLVTLIAATASDLKTLEVEDWVWAPAIVYGVPFTAWSIITGHVNRFLFAFAMLWAALGLAVYFMEAMGQADGLAAVTVALIQPQAAYVALTLGFVIAITAHATLNYAVNLRRQIREPSYMAGLKKIGALRGTLLLMVAVKHPAPFRPDAATTIYSPRTGRFTWLTNLEHEEKPAEGDWVQTPVPAIPFILVGYMLTYLLPPPF
jgi:Flp pilus assembly protein protease CpaA